MNLSKLELSEYEISEIERLLKYSHHDPPKLEDIWQMMDQVWDELGCDNEDIDWQKLSLYYQHPVWILNSLFIKQDPISLQHRSSIAQWVKSQDIKHLLDFGGGMGNLAIMINQVSPKTAIHIYEPTPSQYAIKRLKEFNNIQFVDHLQPNYDCLIATDVLEHIPDPLKTFGEMIESVKSDGYLLIANHFYPCIKCHLPSTFHFRYTFDSFAQKMGLRKIGICEGSHATIYQKISNKLFDWEEIRRQEEKSQQEFYINQIKEKYFYRWIRKAINFIKNPHKGIVKIQNKLKSFLNESSSN